MATMKDAQQNTTPRRMIINLSRANHVSSNSTCGKEIVNVGAWNSSGLGQKTVFSVLSVLGPALARLRVRVRSDNPADAGKQTGMASACYRHSGRGQSCLV